MSFFYALRKGFWALPPCPASASQLYPEKILLQWFEKPAQTVRGPNEISKTTICILDLPVYLGGEKDFLLSNVYKERQKNIWTIIESLWL